MSYIIGDGWSWRHWTSWGANRRYEWLWRHMDEQARERLFVTIRKEARFKYMVRIERIDHA